MDVFDCFWCCMRGTVAGAAILVQASSFCLGENSRGSPWFYSSFSLRRPTLVLSDATSRSGENGSPKRALEETNSASVWVLV